MRSWAGKKWQDRIANSDIDTYATYDMPTERRAYNWNDICQYEERYAALIKIYPTLRSGFSQETRSVTVPRSATLHYSRYTVTGTEMQPRFSVGKFFG